jgi:peptidylprolyl isomerase
MRWLFLLLTLFLTLNGATRSSAVSQTASSDPIVVLHTNMGEITLKLHPKWAPKAVENFVTHVKEGYYNGVTFHRVIRGFMIQGGDPTGTGRGGDSIWHRPFEDEFHRGVAFDRPGLLAMANRGPNTNTSQFFITVGRTPWLNGHYTIFGEVTGGMDTVLRISRVKTGAQDKPIKPVVIEKAELR